MSFFNILKMGREGKDIKLIDKKFKSLHKQVGSNFNTNEN